MAEGAIQCVSRHIKEWRHATGLNQLQFAERCGLDVDKFKRLEAGKGILENAIDLLKIAESCNKDYAELYEKQDGTFCSRGANIPDGIIANVIKKVRAEGTNLVQLAKKLDKTPQAIDYWAREASSPTPWNFSNLITLLGLKSHALQAMVQSEEKEETPAPQVVSLPQPDKSLIEGKGLTKDKNENIELTSREKDIIKLLTLSRNIDGYIAELNDVIAAATSMRDNLMKFRE
jgi:transcriptional regulator with XRE-family HTH domain